MPSESFSTIERPHLWRLTLLLDSRTLYAVARSTVSDTDCVAASIPLADDTAAALEDAVYSVPGLIEDYGRVDVMVRGNAFVALPAGVDGATSDEVAAFMGFDGEDAAVFVDTINCAGAGLLWSMDALKANFLDRTFRHPAMRHSLSVLANYFGSASMGGNATRTFVYFHADIGVDILTFDTGGRMLNMVSKRAATDADALYNVMAALAQVPFDMQRDRLLVCGDRRRLRSLSPLLRRYVRTVLPVIYSQGAGICDAPANIFPISVLPLCE